MVLESPDQSGAEGVTAEMDIRGISQAKGQDLSQIISLFRDQDAICLISFYCFFNVDSGEPRFFWAPKV